MPYALSVDVQSRIDVVNRVHHKIQPLPKLIVEDRLRFLADSGHVVSDIQILVHPLSSLASGLRF